MSTTTSPRSTRGSSRKGAKTPPPVSPAVRATTLRSALEDLHHLDAEFRFIPDHVRKRLEKDLDALITKAADFGCSTVEDLMNRASPLLCSLADVTSVTAFHNDKDSKRLHRHRNTMLTLAACAAVAVGADPEGIYRAAPTLKMRSRKARRPLCDDEIVLCRLHAINLSRGSYSNKESAATYAMTEQGMTPGETTCLQVNSLENAITPTYVVAPGSHVLNGRFLSLDAFAVAMTQPLLKAHAAKRSAEDAQLTYTPRKNLPGSQQAVASVQGVINRFLEPLGLLQDDVTASSVHLWRIQHVWATEGSSAAAERAGYLPEQAEIVERKLFNGLQPSQAPRDNRPNKVKGFAPQAAA